MAKNAIIVSRQELERRDERRVQEIEDIELLRTILLDDIAVRLGQVNQKLALRQSQGRTFTPTLSVTGTYQALELLNETPNAPLFTASFFNDGDDTAYIYINPDIDQEIITLKKGESASLNYTDAKRKIEVIGYKCDKGKTASVRLVAKY